MHIGRSRRNRLYRHLALLGFLVGLSLGPLPAQNGTDSSVVTLALPEVVVPVYTDTVTVPVQLQNFFVDVGGLQLDLGYGGAGDTSMLAPGGTRISRPKFVAAHTTDRTAGWTIDVRPLPQPGSRRFLLYDPGGEDIPAGSGPVMELLFAIPEDGTLLDSLPLLAETVIVSDVVGEVLPSRAMNGSLSVGEVARLRFHSVTADHGDTASLGISLSNRYPVAGVRVALTWDSEWIRVVDITSVDHTARLELEWEADGHGAWIWLHAPAGYELEPGEGRILSVACEIAPGIYSGSIDLRLQNARIMDAAGRERSVTRIVPGRLTVYPGYLDPPQNLNAISGQDHRVPLAWAPPGGSDRGPDPLRQIAIPEPSGSPDVLTLTGFAVYRRHNTPVQSDPESLIAILTADNLSFVDSAVLNEESYSYAVTAVYDQRFESELSNMASAMPLGWIDFALGHQRITAGSQVSLPIWMKNPGPVASVRFRLMDAPQELLSNPRIVVGERAPPDWLVSAERDSLTEELSIIGFSPRLTTIPTGEGEVFRLVMDTDAQVPTEVSLKVLELVISNPHGETYQTRVKDGMVFMDVLLARLQVGTGAPTEPGDTGYVSIFMDNPHPVMAFQMEVRPALDILKVIEVQGGSRLPADAQVAYTHLKGGAVRLIESSFTHTPISIGRGPVATLAYLVSPDAAEGLVGLDLEEVALTDEHGRTLQQTTVSGLFPVGHIRGVFSPLMSSGEPGRTVTIPLALTSSVSLCSFRMEVRYDPRYLTLLSSELLDRLPIHDGLVIQPLDRGHVAVRFVGGDEGMIPPGSGPLFNLVFRLDPQSPVDTVLTLGLERVSAAGCEDQLVFTMGQSGDITIGSLPKQPEHFTVPVRPTGYTHFIRIRSATLGGSYLKPGDEVAVVDTAAWMDAAGNLGPLVVGCGVVQADGSVGITAVMGFERERDGTVLPGARAGGSIHFQAWDRDADREGRLSSDARYVLGKGTWGENNGLTIAELVRIPRERAPVSAALPQRLELSAIVASPFNATNTIRLSVPEETNVKVTIYDLLGREVATLHDGLTAAGFHEVTWHGQDQAGSRVTNGMYFCQVRTPERTVTRKLLLMR